MNRFKNRLWGAICILIVVGMLSACAAPSTSATQAATQPPAPAETATPQVVYVQVTSTPGAGEVKYNPDVSGDIELWHFWASPVRKNGVGHIKAICQQKVPNVKVTDTVKPFGDIWTANVAAVTAGSGMPDVMFRIAPPCQRTPRMAFI